MQTTFRIFDDIAKVGASFLGLALGVRSEFKNSLKAKAESVACDMDLVTREEFEVVRAMAQKAREENERLKEELKEIKG